MNKQRKECETLICKVFDALDPTGMNTEYYLDKFADMDDKEFEKFIEKDFPFIFQHKPFVIEPTFTEMEKAAKVLGVKLLEPVNLPYMYMRDGKPIKSKPALIVYCDVKKLKQFITKKNSMSTNIDNRDMRTGLLLSKDKNSKESDREMESLVLLGHEATMKEVSKYRADAMESKSAMHNIINVEGIVYQKDIPDTIDDSLAKNYIDVYMMGSLLDTNMIGDTHYAPVDYERKIKREI